MNLLTKFLFATVVLFSFPFTNTLSAQNFENFDALLSQMDSAQRAQYLLNLSTLQNTSNQSSFNFNGVLDSLNATLEGPNPIDPNLGGILPSDSIISGYMSTFVGATNLGATDSINLLNEFDPIQAFWANNSDSLSKVFDVYQNQLSPSPLTNVYTTPKEYQFSLQTLIMQQDSTFQTAPALGQGGIKGIFDQLLDPAVFSSLEVFTGVQNAKTNYYGLFETITAPVIGVRSVEQFTKVWEPRWRVQSSWLNNTSNTVNNETITQQQKGFSPFIINGGFDVMYNPIVRNSPIGSPVRLLTLLGIEVGTYAPAHRNSAIAASLNNVGFTTGWGPVIGSGVATKMGNLTFYALGTIAFGDVICGPNGQLANYRYRSNRLEAGVQYGNLISVRYENSLSNNWANDGNKHVRYHQVTVGLPTKTLFR